MAGAVATDRPIGDANGAMALDGWVGVDPAAGVATEAVEDMVAVDADELDNWSSEPVGAGAAPSNSSSDVVSVTPADCSAGDEVPGCGPAPLTARDPELVGGDWLAIGRSPDSAAAAADKAPAVGPDESGATIGVFVADGWSGD